MKIEVKLKQKNIFNNSYVWSIVLFILHLVLELGIGGCVLLECPRHWHLNDLSKKPDNTCANETIAMPLKNQMSSNTTLPMNTLFDAHTRKRVHRTSLPCCANCALPLILLFITKACPYISMCKRFHLLIPTLVHTARKQL